MTGHVGGLPVEELLPVLLGGGGGAWVMLRLATVGTRLARRSVGEAFRGAVGTCGDEAPAARERAAWDVAQTRV